MKTLLLLVLTSALVVSGCDSNDPDLASGQFAAEASGSVKGKFEGSAAFAVSAYALDADMLSLKLVTGSIPSRLDYETETGFFLDVLLWDGSPGTFRLADRESGELVFSTAQSFGFPIQYRIESGTVVVNEVSAGRVAGSFEVVAIDELGLDLDGVRREVRASGKFIAMPAP